MESEHLRSLSAPALAEAVRDGALRATDIAQAYLARHRATDDAVHAFLHLDEDVVREAAAAIDAKRSQGRPLGPLAGVPVSIKDNIVTAHAPTTCGSRILEGHRPVRNATVVDRLLAADAVLFGKTNLDEFGMGSSTENSAFGPTRNPWDLGRVPGGSSGGSAAAVASGQVPLALGSDTGGSVRQPASFCGLVGLKPQYGRVSRSGLVAFASSLDVIGPLARSAAEAALLLSVVAGEDDRDATSLGVPPASALLPDLTGRVLGVPRRWVEGGADAEVIGSFERTCRRFRELGAELRDVELPGAEHAVATYYVLADAEASSNLARYDGVRFGLRVPGAGSLDELYTRTRGRGFGLEVKRRILLGTFVLSAGYYDAYYGQAQRVRARIRAEFDRVLSEVEAILLPTAPTPAFPLGEKSEDPLSMYLNDVYTLPASLAGVPAVSFPAGSSSEGLPLGMQLYGRDGDDLRILSWVEAHENAIGAEGTAGSGAAGADSAGPWDRPLEGPGRGEP